MAKRGLFNLPPRSTREGDSNITNKLNRTGAITTGNLQIKSGVALKDRIDSAVSITNQHLGKYKDKYLCIREEKQLTEYFYQLKQAKHIIYDTETSGLKMFQVDLAGICIGAPELPPAYIPLNHISYISMAKVANQLPMDFVREEMIQLLETKPYIDMFNAKFDINITKCTMDLDIWADWCGYTGARLLNENEPSNQLKKLDEKYCGDGQKGFAYDELFSGIPFTLIPINTAFLYAAHDVPTTYRLNNFQRKYLTKDGEFCSKMGLQDVAFVMQNIEMPLIPIVAEMERTGIHLDLEFQQDLHDKYNKQLDESIKEFNKVCNMYAREIKAYRLEKGTACALDDPINIGSSKQLAILMYDIMGIEPPHLGASKKSATVGKRGTGEPVLEKLDHPIAKAILEYRGIVKLLSTYIDKMPKEIEEKTGKIHCQFNPLGTKTGRFSSNDPNMQNIPAKNKEIRKMFIPSPGYKFISADYSSQEPRITAHMSQDKEMIQAFKDGKQIYSAVASVAFKVPYEDCLENRLDGTFYPEGYVRRQKAKAIVLGVIYSKGVNAIAEDLGITKNEAQEVYDAIMEVFPGLKQFIENSQEMAKTQGYVTTLFGRKRRLPDILLPEFEFTYTGNNPNFTDPLDFEDEGPSGPPAELVEKYTKKLHKAWGRRQKNEIYMQAAQEGLKIKDNGGFIAEASRQCVNSRIQGSAGDQIKMAMIELGKSKEFKETGARLVLQVHDELIAEAPAENADRASEIMRYIMETAIQDYLCVPSVCDVEIMERWNGNK